MLWNDARTHATECGVLHARTRARYNGDAMTASKSGVIAPTETDPATLALKLVGEVKVMHIEPQDVIVLKLTMPLGAAQVEHVIHLWKEVTQLPNPVVALVDGIDVKVVRPTHD